jgi:hypothetical protein
MMFRSPHAQFRRRGAVMAEFVLIIPLIVMLLALLLYLGRLVVRVHHASVMARYEVWRQVNDAPGPHSEGPAGEVSSDQQVLLNETFFGGKASQIVQSHNNGGFPSEPYQQLIDTAGQFSPDARTLADTLIYHSGGDYRGSSGHREGFATKYDNTVARWEGILSVGSRNVENPELSSLIRRHSRIGTDWPYTIDFRASADEWVDTQGTDPHPLRARRDAFWLDFDQGLDSVDGSQSSEYHDSDSQHTGDNLAALVRRLYLQPPGYRGPKLEIP